MAVYAPTASLGVPGLDCSVERRLFVTHQPVPSPAHSVEVLVFACKDLA
jgi:hypothetical protein